MCLKGNRLESEPFRINIQILIGHEEEYILLGRPQFSQSRKDNGLPEFKDLLHLRQKIRRLNYSLSSRQQPKSQTTSLRTNLSMMRKANRRKHSALKAVQRRPMGISLEKLQVRKTRLK